MKVITAGGGQIDLGTVETTPTISIVDYSRRVTDDFGVTTVVERGFARRLSVRLSLPFEQVDSVQRQLADLRAAPAQWIADDRFAWLNVHGFYKEFELDLAVPPLSYCTLTVEGLAEMEAGTDTGGDPAPAGSASSLLLLQPVSITDAMLVASNVAESEYPEWSAGAAYPLGARVIKAATHRIYESAAEANLGDDPAALSGKWIDVGPTNRWAMFDQALGTATSRVGGISITLAPGAIDAVALLDVNGSAVRVQAPGYDRTVPIGAGAMTFRDLPGANGQVTVTIIGAGAVSVGTLLVGHVSALGVTGESPTAGINDFSRKETDDFGEVTIVQRAWAKRMSARALIRTDAVDIVANRIASVRAKPSLWIGDEGTDSLTIYGFFKDFSIEVGENVSTLSVSIEGLSEAAQPAPGAPPPNWPDIVDSDPENRPKPDDGATVGAPVGTPVGDRPAEAVNSQLDAAASGIDQLFTTYGSTVAAAASASAAEASRQASELAKAASETARAVAESAQALSEVARNQAQAAQSAAEQARVDAATFRDQSQTAKVASEAASAVSDSARALSEAARNSAQQYAANADGSAQASAGSASQAQSAQSASATSASAAAASQVSASTAALRAGARANRNIVTKGLFDDGLLGEWSPPASIFALAQPAPNGQTKALRSTVRDVFEGEFQAGDWVGRKLRFTGYARAPGAFPCRAVVQCYTPTQTYPYTWPGYTVAEPGSTTWAPFDFVQEVPPGTVSLRPWIISDGPPDATTHDVQITGLRYEDVTESLAAGTSAAAAATSASAAAASETASGQQAAAAQTAKVDAETARGQAQSAQQAAAQSETNAAGSASSASQQAGVAAQARTDAQIAYGNANDAAILSAGFRDQAQGHAGAASTSASQASASATVASQQASAAQTERQAAETARGGAETARQQAAQSETNAAGSASQASQSQVLAAQARDAATQQAGYADLSRDQAGSARDQAQAAASAASGSASQASASATAAGQSASASEASRQAADTARGGAEAARTAAATSETGAAGSASAAAASQSLTARSLQVAKTFATGNLVGQSECEDGVNRVWQGAGTVDIIPEGVEAGFTKVFRSNVRDLITAPVPGNWTGRTIRASARCCTNYTNLDCGFGVFVYRGTDVVDFINFPVQAPGVSGWYDRSGLINVHTAGATAIAPWVFQQDSVPFTPIRDFRFTNIRFEDVTESLAAAASASASATSASQAAASQTAAGQSASAAEQAKLAAQTAQGGAEAARTAAATSESNSAGSASQAASSQTLAASAKGAAEQAAGRGFVGNFNDELTYWEFVEAGQPSSLAFGPGFGFQLPDKTVYFGVPAGDYRVLASKYAVPSSTGRRWSVRVPYGVYNGNGPNKPNSFAYLRVLSESGIYYSVVAGNGTGAVAYWAGTYNVVPTLDFVTVDASALRVQLVVHANDGSDVGGAVHDIVLVDVTEQAAAAASASASASSASQAAASQTAAGQSASAAEASRIAAQTAQGGAEAARNQAAQSESNAASSASAASQSQQVTARAQLNAQTLATGNLAAQSECEDGVNRVWGSSLTDVISEGVGGGFLNVFRSRERDCVANIVPGPWAGRTIRISLRCTTNYTDLLCRVGLFVYRADGSVDFPAFGMQAPRSGGWYDRAGLISIPASPAVVAIRPWVGQETSMPGAPDFRFTNIRFEDVTESILAAASASASAASASQAQASQTAAEQSASAATAAKVAAQTAQGGAEVAQTASATSASNAASSASAAQASMVLSAQYGSGGNNLLPDTDFASLTAPNWNGYNGGMSAVTHKVGTNSYWSAGIPALEIEQSGEDGVVATWYSNMVECEPLQWYAGAAYVACHRCSSYLVLNFFDGAGVNVGGAASEQGEFTGGSGGIGTMKRLFAKGRAPANARFARLEHIRTPSFPGTGGSWSWMLRPQIAVIPSEAVGPPPFVHGNGSGGAAALRASVAVNASAIATIDGRTQAHWGVSANAGNATAAIEARAITTPGGASQSAVGIVADEFSVKNSQSRKSVLRIAGQEVLIDGNLTATSGIFLGTGAKWQVALRQKTYSLSDGQAVSFAPLDLGNYVVEFAGDNLAPLAAGETYKLYADAKTGTGFTPRIKIVTPGTSSSASVGPGSGSGSGPSVQVARGSNGEASNGNYTVSVSGTYQGYAYNYNQ